MIEKDRKHAKKTEIENEEEQQIRIDKGRIRIAQIRERAEYDDNDLAEEQEYARKLIKNMIEKLIKDR